MPHLKLHLFVRGHLHHAKYRKRRARKLKPIRPSRANELWYKAELLKITNLLDASARKHLLPALKQLAPFKGDTLPPSLRPQFEMMARDFGGIEKTAKRLADLAVRRNLEEVDKRLRNAIKASVGVDISPVFTREGAIRDAMRVATEANFDLITSIPPKYFEKLSKHLENNFVSGIRHEDFIGELYPTLRNTLDKQHEEAPPDYFEKQQLTAEEIFDRVDEIAENRAKLIARDQTAKMNSSFNRVRQTDVGIEQYEWQTAGDERVRDSHAEKDGQIFSWDSPPEDTGHPGEDIQCRCVAIPFFDLDAEEEDLAEDS